MNFRPDTLNNIIGQEEVKKCLEVSISAAKKQQRPLPHILLDGGPGLGKTSLARILAKEMDVGIQIANGAGCRKIKSILPYVAKTPPGTILFIDEIHRLTRMVEEFLYPVLEDFRIDLESGGETTSIHLEPFTIIGATTDSGALSPPLYDRFILKHHLHLYNIEELSKLILINSKKISMTVKEDAAKEIAKRSRDTPRVANNLLKWLNDYCVAHNISVLSLDIVVSGCNMLGVDDKGLDEQDKRYLSVLSKTHPMGLKTIVASVGINEETILTQIEPFLLRHKVIIKMSKGRMLV